MASVNGAVFSAHARAREPQWPGVAAALALQLPVQAETAPVMSSEQQRDISRLSSASSTRSLNTCIVCMDRPRTEMLPCGHSNLCARCLRAICSAPSPRCPTCRASLRVYGRPATPMLRRHSQPVGVGSSASSSTPRLILLLGERAVPLERLVERLRNLNSISRRSVLPGGRGASDLTSQTFFRGAQTASTPSTHLNGVAVRFGSLGVAECAHPSQVAARVRALAPELVVLVADSARLRSLQALVCWDNALEERFGRTAPRIWALLLGRRVQGAVGFDMSDVSDARHCLGLLEEERPVCVQVSMDAKRRGDADVRRLSAEIARVVAPLPVSQPSQTSHNGTDNPSQSDTLHDGTASSRTRTRASRPPRPPRSRTQSGRGGPFSVGARMIRQCL